MTHLHPFFWGALGAAFFWVLAALAAVIWFGLSAWTTEDQAPDTHAGMADADSQQDVACFFIDEAAPFDTHTVSELKRFLATQETTRRPL